MFTGIIQEIGTVIGINRLSGGKELFIGSNKVIANIHYGDSISINGVCQTVTRFSDTDFGVFAMAETLINTNLNSLGIGSKVNLEPALTLQSLLGGHMVTGHIDGKGGIKNITRDKGSVKYHIMVDECLTKYIVDKGSITIDGISLTVQNVDQRTFTVSIIPTTRKETTLLEKSIGDIVNIETDIISKYLEKLIISGVTKGKNTENSNQTGLSEDTLKKHGFI